MKTYFILCFASPILFPALLWVVSLLDRSLVGEWAIVLMFSVIYGGIPYLVSLAIIGPKIDYNSCRSWIAGSLLLPAVFGILLLIFLMPFTLIGGGIAATFALAGFGLLVGYGYVSVWLIGLGFISGLKKLVIT